MTRTQSDRKRNVGYYNYSGLGPQTSTSTTIAARKANFVALFPFDSLKMAGIKG